MKRPNFLVIVADDLGYSDIGAFGGEINTPNLDRLAYAGTRFTDFHSAPACSPTRAMLLSGTDHHIAGIGTMLEVAGQAFGGAPGYEGYLNDRVVALPELLARRRLLHPDVRQVAPRQHHRQVAMGSRVRAFVRSAAGRRQPLRRHQGRRFLACTNGLHRGRPVRHGRRRLLLVRLLTPTPCCVTSANGRPMMIGLSSPTSHFRRRTGRCRLPTKSIATYRGRYDGGPDELREARLAALKRLGLCPPDVVPHPVVADDAPEWADMTPDERALSARSMEVYAAHGGPNGLERRTGDRLPGRDRRA